ncbi:unnamed protein product [Microthlaspi erraticum]|uniref:Uncharacterized protein n=1 Tax=Microthlaspi erraticum TaxID=1685480 RepID=A0A6D2JYE8_9BRAS|nr:unnamed protein product [Microthlaspi erraticum]CAA7055801.1 unnamed protein product [Microthlaspi erraticum]
MSEVASFLPAQLLYHSAFHWITPGRVWNVLRANVETSLIIPDAIKLRMTYGPSGAALITTTAAVLRAFSEHGFMNELKELNVVDVTKIFEFDEKIRENPPVYHCIPTAYGLSYLSQKDREAMEDVKEEAKKIAPLLQGFCETILKHHPLGKQKVLVKHSNDNPVMKQKAKRFFQHVSKGSGSLGELYGAKRQKKL